MTKITLLTTINAPIGRCFDLARSIDLHMISMQDTGERAIAGRTSGLAEPGDTVTWEATHFGIKQQLTSKMERVERPTFFSDRMVTGAFKSMYHEHIFTCVNGQTQMKDNFCYETPLGIAGKLFDVLVLKKYMTRFLLQRNTVLKSAAEGTMWKEILHQG